MRNLAGRPLLSYTLALLAAVDIADRMLVSSEDGEILEFARLRGYEAIERPMALAGDSVTITDLALHVVKETGWNGTIAVFQPTSPMLSADSVRGAFDAFRRSGVTSLSTVVREPHLFWHDRNGTLGSATPLFQSRLNRQELSSEVLRETGAIQIVCSSALQGEQNIVTSNHFLYELPAAEGLDIDTEDDMAAAERILRRGTVIFRLTANRLVGAGHLYHCVRLAEELADQDLRFLLRDCDMFPQQYLDRLGYTYVVETDLLADLKTLSGTGPVVVINDVLDTAAPDILAQRSSGYLVVNVEDLGSGARFANWVINALYEPPVGSMPNLSSGHLYATLRSEFCDLPKKIVRERAERILITFGGTDPCGLGHRFACLLAREQPEWEIRVILGAGYSDIQPFPPTVLVLRSVSSMAAEMMAADIVLTSAGRTVYEAAATGTPLVVVAQNAREASHSHLGYDRGVVFLGIGDLVSDALVSDTLSRMMINAVLRTELSDRLRHSLDTKGAVRIASGVRKLLTEGSL